MKRIIWTSLAILLTLASPAPATAQSGTDLFQQALRTEQVDGDLKAAMALYQRILREHATNRALSAKTLVQLGRAYEKMGNADARSSYQRVVREYADQAEPAAVARARLAALQTDAAAATGRGPVARRLLSSWDSTDSRIENPRVMVPSPDGRRVAYVQTSTRAAGVYVRDLASGAIQQVAAREAAANMNNWSSVWSADGKRLAFVQTSGETPATAVRIYDFTSRETVAIPGLDARGLYLLDWSRDGRYLLCNNLRGTLDLVAVADGRTTIVSDSIWAGSRASFSPDGRFVAFAAGKYGSWTLYTQPAAGGTRQRIAETREGVYLHPLWSPDGRAIAYHQPDGVWVAPMDGGVPRGVPRLAYRTSSPRWGVAWTEAGGLYFTVNSQREIPYQVAVDPAVGRTEEAGTRRLPHHPDNQRSFAWSPDMQRIAFANWDGDLTIYTADGDRMTSQKVAAPDEAVASLWWSPDGREVQYEHVQTGGPISQWRVTVKALDASTGRMRELFPRVKTWMASLNADGRTMLFARHAADSAMTEYLVAAAGRPDGRVVATAPSVGANRIIARPKISPEGDQLFLVRNAGDAPDTLTVLRTDGTSARQVAIASRIFSAMWDPSGRFIGYTGMANGKPMLRVVEVATGVERDLALPSSSGRLWWITDWSRDGRFVGVEETRVYWEYWVVQGLLEGGR